MAGNLGINDHVEYILACLEAFWTTQDARDMRLVELEARQRRHAKRSRRSTHAASFFVSNPIYDMDPELESREPNPIARPRFQT